MASFRFRSNRWQARVRRLGHPDLTKSFIHRIDAERWARSAETEIDRGTYVHQHESMRLTLRDLLARYVREVIVGKPHEKVHTFRFDAMAKRDIGRLNLVALTPSAVANYRDQRLQIVTPGTVIRELACLSAILNHARKEWGITVVNPIPSVRKPTAPKGRDRQLTTGELARLLQVLEPNGRSSPWMKPLVLLALETAMRRGELLSLRWSDVDLASRTATLWHTKNGDKRVVPLSTRAIAVLNSIPRSIKGVVFPINGFTVSAAFERATIRCELVDFRFHDLRHMAVTELSKRLPNLVELSAVTGHRSLAMLRRYYHPNPAELALKLR